MRSVARSVINSPTIHRLLIPGSDEAEEAAEEMSSDLGSHWVQESDDEDLSNPPVSGDPNKYEAAEQWEYDASPVSSPGGQDVARSLLDLQSAEATEDNLEGRGDVYLQLLRQPEDTHRARYMSEGSRGAIKDQSGASHCTVQLVGYNRPTGLQIFAATAVDPLKPHPFYRLIPVTGKGSGQTTKCREITAHDGIQCIEVMLRPEREMTAVLDCVGILKMCSAETKRRRGKSTTASTIRLVFRVHVPLSQDKAEITKLQVLSTPIYCGQQLGYPEIRRASRSSATVRGGSEVFIIGRNFDKNARVHFREYNSDGQLVWNADASMEGDYLSQCHMIFTTPAYRDLSIKMNVEVTMTVECGSKTSHPMPFTYTPESVREMRRSRDMISVSASEWGGATLTGIAPTSTGGGSTGVGYGGDFRLPVGSSFIGGNSCSCAMTTTRSSSVKPVKSRKRPMVPQSPTLTKILQSLEESKVPRTEEENNVAVLCAGVTSPRSVNSIVTSPGSYNSPLTPAGHAIVLDGHDWPDLALMNWTNLGTDGLHMSLSDSMMTATVREMEDMKPQPKHARSMEVLPMSPMSSEADLGDSPQEWF